jgi:predicted permease
MDFLRELRHAWRSLRRAPVFLGVVVLVLGLSIGAFTTAASLAESVLIAPLPFPDQDRLVILSEEKPDQGRVDEVSAANFLDWRTRAASFSGLAAWTEWGYVLTGQGEPAELVAVRATASLFDVLGVAPSLGRGLTPDDERPGGAPVAIVSHGFWQSRLGGDPGAAGRAILLDGNPVTVVGVMPARFRFPDRDDVGLWVPLVLSEHERERRTQRMFQVLGRLSPGIGLATAQAEFRGIAASLAGQYPAANAGWTVRLRSASEVLVPSKEIVLLLGAAVATLVLIAGANVVSLSLARSLSRSRELGIRAALGAGIGGLVRTLLAEGIVVTALGAAAGVLFAGWFTRLVVTLDPGLLTHWREFRLSGTVLGTVLVLSVLVSLLVGLVPARYHRHRGLMDLVGRERTGLGGSLAGARLRRWLVVAQVALSTVLLVSATLLILSLARVLRERPGFVPERVVVANINLPTSRYPEDHLQYAFFERVLQRLQENPAVSGAAFATTTPMASTGVDHDIPFWIEGREVPPGEEVDFRIATAGYFGVLDIPVRGREFSPADREDGVPVVVVNQALARRWFPGENPLGRRIKVGGGRGWLEIVGIAGDVRHRGLQVEPRPEVFVPFRQYPSYGTMNLVVRAAGSSASTIALIRDVVHQLDPDQPVSGLAPLTEQLARTTAAPRFHLLIFGGLATMALILATAGVYGLIAFVTQQRRREFGIRLALGATPASILRGVLWDGGWLVGLGLVGGGIAAVATTGFLGALLYKVEPAHPLAIAGAVTILAVVAVVATLGPARRAARVDPVGVLREE